MIESTSDEGEKIAILGSQKKTITKFLVLIYFHSKKMFSKFTVNKDYNSQLTVNMNIHSHFTAFEICHSQVTIDLNNDFTVHSENVCHFQFKAIQARPFPDHEYTPVSPTLIL